MKIKTKNLICSYTANWSAKNKNEINEEGLKQVANRLRYLTTGFLIENGIPFHEFNLIGFNKGTKVKEFALKRHWKEKIKKIPDNFWYQLF